MYRITTHHCASERVQIGPLQTPSPCGDEGLEQVEGALEGAVAPLELLAEARALLGGGDLRALPRRVLAGGDDGPGRRVDLGDTRRGVQGDRTLLLRRLRGR